MQKSFFLNILIPEKTLYKGSAESITVPGEIGYLGILAEHAPLMTTLVPGKIVVRGEKDSNAVFHSKGKGFLEVLKNKVTVLLETIEEKSDPSY